ncbi:MAG: RNA polymerase sigma factor [Acidobacteria bacterium]|nr:RNA polymerase sigma factor [Acidobacteriota bacterium]
MDLDKLIHDHGDRLLRAAFLLCRNPHDAQDLVQETFCRAMEAAGRFRGESGTYTWLYAILRNTCLNRRRGLFRWFSLDRSHDREDGRPGPGAWVEAQETRGLMDALLTRLPFRHREVILLRYVDELKITEIAATLRVSPGTVKSRLHHAVRRLQKAFPRERVPALRSHEGEEHAM